jgi:hypothetical protein
MRQSYSIATKYMDQVAMREPGRGFEIRQLKDSVERVRWRDLSLDLLSVRLTRSLTMQL